MAVKLTPRSEHLEAMRAAGKNAEACWAGFTKACSELSQVASKSDQYSPREKKAARAIGLVARVERGFTKIMRDEFNSQYQILGAPGDFGYDQPEGQAMQAVYEWWDAVCVASTKGGTQCT